MSTFSIRIGISKFISYDIMSRIQKMGANVQEELTDMTHYVCKCLLSMKVVIYRILCIFQSYRKCVNLTSISLGINANSTKSSPV